jgi:DNA-binding MarR family transcriptional regulator
VKVSRSDHLSLAAFRYEIRKFLAFSEQAARAAGLEPQQHQMLLAIHGLPEGVRPTIGAVAERLCVQHHSAVALADKLEALGMVRRERAEDDRRQVFLVLTGRAADVLEELSAAHRTQLRKVGPQMVEALAAILDDRRVRGGNREARREGG